MPGKDTILIISKNHPEINADFEIANIQKALKGAKSITVVDPRGLEPHEVVTAIRDHDPEVLHFIGHGALCQGGRVPVVLLSSEAGTNSELDLGQLTAYLREIAALESRRRKLVFLNACFVGHWATRMLEFADVIIGTKQVLPEETAQFFSCKFYEHIALANVSVGQAFRDAKHATQIAKRGGESIFIVSNPMGVANEIFLGSAPQPEIVVQPEHEWDAFIAYCAPDDAEAAQQLAENLHSLDLRVFLDSWEVIDGGVMTRALEQGIVGSRSGVLLVSPAAVRSELVQNQYHALLTNAVERPGRRLIPVMLEPTELPPFLKIRKPADFIGKTGDDYLRELERLRRGVLGLRSRPSKRGPLRVPS